MQGWAAVTEGEVAGGSADFDLVGRALTCTALALAAACLGLSGLVLCELARGRGRGRSGKAPPGADEPETPKEKAAPEATAAGGSAERAAHCASARGNDQDSWACCAKLDWFSLFCCYGRGDGKPQDAPNTPAPSLHRSVHPDTVSRVTACGYSIDDVVKSGVPEEDAPAVAQLAASLDLHPDAKKPLADPKTLWRFVKAREGNAEAAKAMYDKTCAWRISFSIRSAMEVHGRGEAYDTEGRLLGGDSSSWAWTRHMATPEAAFVQRYGFFGRLTMCAPADGAAIAVWRVGDVDVDGYFREGAEAAILRGFAAHMEDLLQASRAASARQGRVVRARLVIDARGVSLSHLRHMGKLKDLQALGRDYFPEIAETVTVVRAPRAFTAVFNAAQSLMSAVQRRKVRILGEDFAEGLHAHAGVSRELLPVFLGGHGLDEEVAASARVPKGAGGMLR